MASSGASHAISAASLDVASASAQTIASVRRCACAASASCASASESPDSGSAASRTRCPAAGIVGASGGSAANGAALGIGATAGSRLSGFCAEAAVAASVGAVGMRSTGGGLAPLFWSCNWIVGRGLSHDVPPFAMTFYRWLFAIIILAPFGLPHLRVDLPLVRRHWKALLALGVVGIGTHNALAYLGLRYTTAMNGVILNSFIPVMIVALS